MVPLASGDSEEASRRVRLLLVEIIEGVGAVARFRKWLIKSCSWGASKTCAGLPQFCCLFIPAIPAN